MDEEQWAAHEVVERVGVQRVPHVSPDDAFAVRLLDNMETYEDEDVVNNIGYIDDVAFCLRFVQEPDKDEQTIIAAVVYEWARQEQNRIYDAEPNNAYGWFHRVSHIVFEGDTARWYIDTSCAGVKIQSIGALQEWMAGTPGPRAIELVLGWPPKGTRNG